MNGLHDRGTSQQPGADKNAVELVCGMATFTGWTKSLLPIVVRVTASSAIHSLLAHVQSLRRLEDNTTPLDLSLTDSSKPPRFSLLPFLQRRFSFIIDPQL